MRVVGRRGAERAVAVAEDDGDIVGVVVQGYEVEVVIAIHIGEGHIDRVFPADGDGVGLTRVAETISEAELDVDDVVGAADGGDVEMAVLVDIADADSSAGGDIARDEVGVEGAVTVIEQDRAVVGDDDIGVIVTVHVAEGDAEGRAVAAAVAVLDDRAEGSVAVAEHDAEVAVDDVEGVVVVKVFGQDSVGTLRVDECLGAERAQAVGVEIDRVVARVDELAEAVVDGRMDGEEVGVTVVVEVAGDGGEAAREAPVLRFTEDGLAGARSGVRPSVHSIQGDLVTLGHRQRQRHE